MKYMGSKARIANKIIPIILAEKERFEHYVEPFVGGCNLIDKIPSDIKKIASDNNFYLIEMWKALQQGWKPPKEISREFYNECREKSYKNITDNAHIIGYIGFNGSYGGRFYDGGFAGISQTKGGQRNYPLEAYNNVTNQINNITDITFQCCSFEKLEIPPKSIIYCDPPYSDTKKYSSAKSFDYVKFWEWCRTQLKLGHKVFVSEYKAPDDFVCIWEQEVSSSLSANGQIGKNKISIEKLFTLREVNNENRRRNKRLQ